MVLVDDPANMIQLVITERVQDSRRPDACLLEQPNLFGLSASVAHCILLRGIPFPISPSALTTG